MLRLGCKCIDDRIPWACESQKLVWCWIVKGIFSSIELRYPEQNVSFRNPTQTEETAISWASLQVGSRFFLTKSEKWVGPQIWATTRCLLENQEAYTKNWQRLKVDKKVILRLMLREICQAGRFPEESVLSYWMQMPRLKKGKFTNRRGGREYGCQFAERSHLELLLREAAVRRTKVERPKEPGQVSMSWVAWAAYVCLGSFSLLFFGRWISVKTLFPTTNVAKFHKQRTALKVFKGWILSSIMSQKVLLYMTGS